MAIEEGRGRSVQIPNDVNVLEIIQVTVFQNQSSIGKRLFTGQFTFSNNKVTVKTNKPQFKIKVEYEKTVSREEFQQSVPPVGQLAASSLVPRNTRHGSTSS